MAASKPDRITIRAYNVGFGDCFLLKFRYPKFERRVLIDYGTSAAPLHPVKDYMKKVAQDIREQCREAQGGYKLHAVVLTHRHLDHISGFGSETGKVIASLQPDVVVQPWTEDPDAPTDATQATSARRMGFRAALDHMNSFAAAVAKEAAAGSLKLGRDSRACLQFLGETNLKNLDAVKNLMEMGRKGKTCYVNCGSRSGLEEVLPGVAIDVLGPPTLEQCDSIRNQREKDPAEFWFQAFWGFQAGAARAGGEPLFPKAPAYSSADIPADMRWFVKRADAVRVGQLFELVRELDKQMNNTSVVLLFRAGGRTLLFPGDAQIENWSYALGQERYRKLLAEVDFYKVGHHGSLNATPKSLWELFAHRRSRKAAPLLETLLSTRPGKHGSTKNQTEVPRRTLVEALEKDSALFSTETLASKDLFQDFEFRLRR